MPTKSNMEWTDLRPYNETHPWLVFGLHVNSLSPDLLALLGGVASRCRVLEDAFLPPDRFDNLQEIYLAKGVHGTTAIEGNTLSVQEVKKRIEGKGSLPKSKEYQQREVDNIIFACKGITKRLVEGAWDEKLSVERIKLFNRLVLWGLPQEKGVLPGKVRTYSVGIFDYVPPPAKYCDEQLARLCVWLNGLHVLDASRHRIANSIVRAIVCHIYIAWIHPFGDGNGRTARLLEFNLLVAAGIPAVAAHLLSNHYNHTRNEYFRHLAEASKSGGDIGPFLEYAIQGMLDGLTEQYKAVEKYQKKITWRNFVYSRFKAEPGPATHRRRQLVLALGEAQNTDNLRFIEKREIPKLNTELAALYAKKTAKTLSRDLNELESMDLVWQHRSLVIATTWRINSFKPERRDEKVLAAKAEARKLRSAS